MSSLLLHSPADILRRAMIQLAKGSDPDGKPMGVWPMYCSYEPAQPDNCITFQDDTGIDAGRVMQGDRIQYPGFQIRLRAIDHPTGYAKLQDLAIALDLNVLRIDVAIVPNTYRVQWVTRGMPMFIGKNKMTSNRYVFTLNGNMSVIRTDE